MQYLMFVFLFFFPHQELKIEGEGERERERLEGSEYLSSSLGVVIEGGGSNSVPSLVVVLTIVCRSL